MAATSTRAVVVVVHDGGSAVPPFPFSPCFLLSAFLNCICFTIDC